jgi:hypothetical protein
MERNDTHQVSKLTRSKPMGFAGRSTHPCNNKIVYRWLALVRQGYSSLIYKGVLNKMRWTHVAFSLFLFAGPNSQVFAQKNDPPRLDRAQSVINAFQVICQLELPNLSFERIDGKAAAMRMPLQQNTSAPSADGSVTRHKSWIGGLTDGPFLLFLDDLSGPKSRGTSCAIIADVPDRDAFRAEVVRTLKLPGEPAPQLEADGSRSFYWDGALGASTTIVCRDFARSGKPGVMLKLVVRGGT